jgi:hypothetical protein
MSAYIRSSPSHPLLICAATVVRGCSTLRGIVKEGPATLDYMQHSFRVVRLRPSALAGRSNRCSASPSDIFNDESNRWLSVRDMCSPTMRAITSVDPPANAA